MHVKANSCSILYIPNFVMGVIWQPRDVECRASSLEILLKYVPSHVKVDVACMCGCVGACTSAFVLVSAFVFVYVYAGVCVCVDNTLARDVDCSRSAVILHKIIMS